jgi:tetratricopeptide (TPR) repeat protein
MMRFLMWLSMLLAFVVESSAQEPGTLFQEGVEKYRQGDWAAAATAWEQVHNRGEASGALYYNLGNAYHRMGEIGRSILYYERARRILPRDRDVSANLDLAEMGTVDRIESPIRLAVWDWVDELRDYFSLRELAWIFGSLGVVLIAAFVLTRIGPGPVRRAARMALTSVLVVYVIVGGWYVWRSQLEAQAYGVVLETKVDVFSAPDSSATQVFTLHEGTKVRTLDNLTGWTRIWLRDGRQGWLPMASIEKI